MPEHDFKIDDPIEAVKMPKGKQTIPAGTKGIVVTFHPQEPELIWVKTDEPVKAPMGKGQDFFVLPNEIKKI
ncbi:hypothetical protein ES703_88961 [subsurface metagenome]